MNKIIVAALLSASVAACATTPPPPPGPPPGPGPSFRASDFQWSARPGSGSIQGQVAYGAGRFSCAGQPVILTPDAPYSRARMVQQYGSAERAALPVPVARSRQVAPPSAEFSSFVRRTNCDAQGRFEFQGLPAGGWFIIAVAQPTAQGAEPMALMRHAVTRAGSAARVVIN